jgi:hypothetical protein
MKSKDSVKSSVRGFSTYTGMPAAMKGVTCRAWSLVCIEIITACITPLCASIMLSGDVYVGTALRWSSATAPALAVAMSSPTAITSCPRSMTMRECTRPIRPQP